jgi:Peptidase family M28
MNAQSVGVARSTTKKTFFAPLFAWIFLGGLLILAVMTLNPPRPVAATASLAEFSAERAMLHLQTISREPHPIGSGANTAVRDYLVSRLAEMGASPQVFQAMGVFNGRRRIAIGNTHDITGRIPGTANSKAVMLVAHYDSVSTGPGAGDDGAGVAAILETVRALRSGPALKNDIIVLFTDGEEPGLLGADAFASSHPWFKDVGLVLNFEGRGNRGPSLLFETSIGNSSLIQAASHSVPHPIGSSLFYTLYKWLPNDTDFTVFSKFGVPGLNFAFGENLDAYHSRLDTFAKMSAGSLQHHGTYALGLSRYFGQADLARMSRNGDDVFFNILGSIFIAYSEHWVVPTEIVASVLLLLGILIGLRRFGLALSRIILAMLWSIILLVAVPVVLGALAYIFTSIFSGRIIASDSSANLWLLTGFFLLGLCIGMATLAKLRKHFGINELWQAGLVVICAVNWAVALALPEASYLLLWPLLLAAAGTVGVSLATENVQSDIYGLSSILGTAITLLLFAPVAYLVYVFFTFHWMSVTAMGLLIGLFFILCSPFMSMAVPHGSSRRIIAALFACASATIVTGAVLSHPSASHPHHDSVFYSMNADEHSALWISYEHTADAWTSQFFPNKSSRFQPAPDYLAGSQRPVLSAAARMLNMEAPVAEIKTDKRDGTLRKLSMNVRSKRNADVILLTLGSDVRLVSIKVGNRDIIANQNSGYFRLSLLGMDSGEANLELTVDAPSKLTFWLADESFGLPNGIRERPETFIADEGSDATLVCRKYSL